VVDASGALIGPGRIEEAVADHPSARRQRRPDRLGKVLGTRQREHKSLGGGPERRDAAGE
jgi:hypothetical protein